MEEFAVFVFKFGAYILSLGGKVGSAGLDGGFRHREGGVSALYTFKGRMGIKTYEIEKRNKTLKWVLFCITPHMLFRRLWLGDSEATRFTCHSLIILASARI